MTVALQVLGRLGPVALAAVPAVTQSLLDRNPMIELAAIKTLGQIGPGANMAIPLLIPKLRHYQKSFREAVAEALEKIDPNWASQSGVPAE